MVAKDAAVQQAVSTSVLRIDRTAPANPDDVAIERNVDGSLSFAWTNPDQGTAAPIVGARYEVCDASGANCAAGEPAWGTGLARVDSVAVPSGQHQVRVWLQDEAGNADRANAAVLSVDPSTITAPRVLGTDPPILHPSGPKPSPRLKITSARRSGSTLTLTGTIARGATAKVSAALARTRNGKAVARASVRPRRGKWTLRVRLTPALRRAGAMYLSVGYAGQASFRKTTVHRRLAQRPAGRTLASDEFSLEARSS